MSRMRGKRAASRMAADGDIAPFHVDAASNFHQRRGMANRSPGQAGACGNGRGRYLRTHLAALRRLLKVTPVDTVSRRRRIADETVRRGSYIFRRKGPPEIAANVPLFLLASVALSSSCSAGNPPPEDSEGITRGRYR